MTLYCKGQRLTSATLGEPALDPPDYDDCGPEDYSNVSTKCAHCGRFFSRAWWGDRKFCNQPKCLGKGVPHG